MNKKILNKSGFTLIELVFAMGIISLVMLTFFTIVNTSIRSNSKNEKDIVAINIAQSEIENLREQIKKINVGWTVGGKSIDPIINKTVNYELEKDKVIYNISVEIELCKRIDEEEENDYKNLYELSVTVNPKEFSKKISRLTTQIMGKTYNQ